jgi:hypothetical protein
MQIVAMRTIVAREMLIYASCFGVKLNDIIIVSWL